MMETPEGRITFSFISPVYNEQDGLEAFYRRLTDAAESIGEPYEIIFVNDGSTDETPSILHRLASDDIRVRVVEFSRNFGHQAAVTAGYDYACGRAVISLDADGQHPPEMIPQLVARWREGFEVVYTVRRDTKGISRIRRGLGRLMYRVIRASSGVELTDQADFRLLDRRAVDALKSVREQARFVRGLVNWIGFRQVAVPYTAQERMAGKSNYTLRQLMGMSGAGTFNYSVRPLRIAPYLGAIMLAAAICYAVASLALWPFGLAPGGFSHLAMGLVALFGLQFLALGILGEYVGRIFTEAKDRPLYVVRETCGFPKPADEQAALEKRTDRQGEERFSVFT